MTNPRPGSARWHSRVRRAAGGIAAVRSARNLNESSAPRWFARSWRSKLQAPTSREPRPGSARWQIRARAAPGGIAAVRSSRRCAKRLYCEEPQRIKCAKVVRAQLAFQIASPNVAGTAPGQRPVAKPHPASRQGHSRGSVCEEPYRIDCAKVVRAQLAFQIASPNVAETAPGQRPPRNANRTERFSKATLLPFLAFGTFFLLSSRNESRRPPRRRNLTKEISPISPKAKIIAHTHFCVSAQKCVCDNIRSPHRTHS